MKLDETTPVKDVLGLPRTSVNYRQLFCQVNTSQPTTKKYNLNHEPWVVSSYYKNEQIIAFTNSGECMGVNREVLQLHAVYKKLYSLLQVTQESVSVLQFTWEPISGTASHACCIWTFSEIQSSYVKIIFTKLYITCLLPLALLLMLCTRNNTDSNKLMIFSGIASYYIWW